MGAYSSRKPVIAVVGSKNSGKTMAIEILVRGLSSRRYRVGTVKHIPKQDFTIDKEGTDTWRHARAGAKIVVSVSPNELAKIIVSDTSHLDLNRITTEFGEDADVVILEGFRELVKNDPNVLKIVAVKDLDEIQEASRTFSPILAYVGSISAGEVSESFNYIDLQEERNRLVDLVYERLKDVKGRSKPSKRTRVLMDGRSLPCKRFVQEIIRKTVLAMVSTLKGVEINGDEEVDIMIRSKAE